MLVTFVATLDVPRHVVEYLARLLAAHQRRISTRRRSRALGPFRQAVLALRWFRDCGCVHCLARNAGVFHATGYRHLNEGMTRVILGGTLIGSDRLAGVRENGNGLWFSRQPRRRQPFGSR
ncbi:hypothetical protein [Streptomyces sp. NPDC047014]|uniref:hypothetical protein n=1 Tax=Streptomyces sp. NPDC047014 TaxID=3155736 RepID=UPI0033C10262